MNMGEVKGQNTGGASGVEELLCWRVQQEARKLERRCLTW